MMIWCSGARQRQLVFTAWWCNKTTSGILPVEPSQIKSNVFTIWNLFWLVQKLGQYVWCIEGPALLFCSYFCSYLGPFSRLFFGLFTPCMAGGGGDGMWDRLRAQQGRPAPDHLKHPTLIRRPLPLSNWPQSFDNWSLKIISFVLSQLCLMMSWCWVCLAELWDVDRFPDQLWKFKIKEPE